jgi:hypothetical protein
MGAAVIPFAFAGRILDRFGFFLVWDWEIRVSFGWSRRIGETLGAALAVSSDLHSPSGYYWEFLFILYCL